MSNSNIEKVPVATGVKAEAQQPPIWLLVLVTLSGTLAMHMFVPALATAARDLHTSPAVMQSSITVYIFGLAIGQLIYGPISDKYGRRPTLFFGLMLFTAAGVVCVAASSPAVLIAARFAQAMGGCSGLLLGRTIVRDTSTAEGTVSRLATISLVTLVGPGLAPLAGGLVAGAFGWRCVLAVFVALGTAGLLLSWWLLPETRPESPTGSPRSVAVEYASLLRSPAFLGCVIGGSSSMAFYAYVVVAPFLFAERFGQPAAVVGLYLSVNVVGICVGNLLSLRLASRVSATSAMLAANGLGLVSAVLLLAQLTLFEPTEFGIVAAMFGYCAGAGMCAPLALASAMSVRPGVAGSASGIYGFGQMAFGALCSALAGLGSHHALTAAVVMVAASLMGRVGLVMVKHAARVNAAN